MTFRNKRNKDPAHPVPGSEWPFPDDLDDYERELEASSARRMETGRQHEAELNRYQEMARTARATGNCGPIPDGVPPPTEWPDYNIVGRKADNAPVAPLPPAKNGNFQTTQFAPARNV